MSVTRFSENDIAWTLKCAAGKERRSATSLFAENINKIFSINIPPYEDYSYNRSREDQAWFACNHDVVNFLNRVDSTIKEASKEDQELFVHYASCFKKINKQPNGNDMADFYSAFYSMHKSNLVEKVNLFQVIYKRVINPMNTSSLGMAAKLMNILAGLNSSEQIKKVTQLLDVYLENKDRQFFQSFYEWLNGRENKRANIDRLCEASLSQIEFCLEQGDGDARFLGMLVDEKIDRVPSGGALVALTREQIEQFKVASCEPLSVFSKLMKIFGARHEAQEFLAKNKSLLLKLNNEMLDLLGEHADNVEDKVQFIKVLCQAKTHADNAFMLAIFSQLSKKDVGEAINLFTSQSLKDLSDNQKKCVQLAFQSGDAKSEEKLAFLKAMFKCNFPLATLQNVATLYSLITDRSKLVADLVNLEAGNPMFTNQFIAIIQALHDKHISITYDYVNHLAGLRYLSRFREIIKAFPEDAIQAIFDPRSKKSTAGDWVKAFMLQAFAINNPTLATLVIKLTFGLWTFAQANAAEFPVSDLLGMNFVEHFVQFLDLIDVQHAPAARRFALLAEVQKARQLLFPVARESGFSLFSFFSGDSERASSQLATQIYQRLGVRELMPDGRWVFNNPADDNSYRQFIQRANLRLTLESDKSYLALTDGSVSSAALEVEEKKQQSLTH